VLKGHVIKMAMPMQPVQTSFAHLYLDCEKIIIIKINCRVKFGLTILAGGKNTVSHQNMVMDMGIEITAERRREVVSEQSATVSKG
jgi:hypothetical protein